MDLSPLIFVALAVAWVTYLVPKAIRHHDEVNRSRSVERFSHTMRVLARREVVDGRDGRLVLSPGRPRTATVVTTKETVTAERPAAASAPAAPAAPARSARAPRSAASRRRRVLGVLLVLLATVAVLGATGVLGWAWTAAPAALLVAWLVACRLMVRSERAAPARTTAPAAPAAPEAPAATAASTAASTAQEAVQETAQDDDAGEATQEVAVVVVDAEDTSVRPALAPGVWDPVPMTLPTYVDKARATRSTVRTIDLDSTGVWTSGRSEVDSALAREAEEAERAARAEEQRRAEQRRATGS